ncbi:MAG: hypothetical protein V8S95_06815 [Odoribacter sp.]
MVAQSLRNALNQRYSVNFEGGDENFRYGIDLRYLGDNGVMKESGRKNYGLSVTFQYNIAKDFFIRNDVLIDNVKGKNLPMEALVPGLTRILMTGSMMKMEN